MFGNLSYTNKDITSIRNEIIEFIKENNPDWVDFNESSIQMQYTEMLAGVADMLCYYLDSQALETFLTTARQKKNINAILKTINYEYEIIGPSRGAVVFTRTPHEEENNQPVYLNDRYLIPKYLELWTDKNVKFITTEEMSMPGDMMSITIPVAQGTRVEKSFPIETVKQSFRLQVINKPVPLEFVEIENEGYSKVDDAFILTEGGPYYSVHNDSYNNVYILFTYDWKRYLPEHGNLVVSYVDALGKDGNVESEKIVNYGDGIRVLDESETDVIELSVINPSATYGGFSEVDIRKHQANAKKWLLTHDTIVLMSDFETMLRKESWIMDCVCFDWRKDDTIVQYPYQLKAWVVTIEGPSVNEKELINLTYKLQKKTVIMNNVEIKSADYVYKNISAVLSVDGNNETNREEIRQAVEKKMRSWYMWNNFISGDVESKLQFGLSIDVTRLKYDIAGIASSIKNVELSLDENLYLGKTEFLYCTTLTVELAPKEI